MSAEVGLHPLAGVQEGASKAMAAGFLLPFWHAAGQGHDPVSQFVRGSEAHPLARTAAVQGNQHMALVMGGSTGAIKAVVVVQQGHLDAVFFQQFGQMGDSVAPNGPLGPQLLCCDLSLFRATDGKDARTLKRSLRATVEFKAALQADVALQVVAHLLAHLVLALLGHAGQLAELQRRQLHAVGAKEVLRLDG